MDGSREKLHFPSFNFLTTDMIEYDLCVCRSEDSFTQYFSEMPWLAVPYTDEARRSRLNRLYGIQGVYLALCVCLYCRAGSWCGEAGIRKACKWKEKKGEAGRREAQLWTLRNVGS